MFRLRGLHTEWLLVTTAHCLYSSGLSNRKRKQSCHCSCSESWSGMISMEPLLRYLVSFCGKQLYSHLFTWYCMLSNPDMSGIGSWDPPSTPLTGKVIGQIGVLGIVFVLSCISSSEEKVGGLCPGLTAVLWIINVSFTECTTHLPKQGISVKTTTLAKLILHREVFLYCLDMTCPMWEGWKSA